MSVSRVNFLASESKIYVLICRIQVMSVMSRVNCNRIEDLFKKGCEGLQNFRMVVIFSMSLVIRDVECISTK